MFGLLYKCKHLRMKQKALREVEADLLFLKKVKQADKAVEEIKKYRNKLKEEREKKENANNEKIEEYAYSIAKYEDIMRRYHNLLNAREDLQKYIDLIKTWFKN